MAADVAVLDLAVAGTAVPPDRLVARPRRVPHVVVGGEIAVRGGVQTAARPGRIGRG